MLRVRGLGRGRQSTRTRNVSRVIPPFDSRTGCRRRAQVLAPFFSGVGLIRTLDQLWRATTLKQTLILVLDLVEYVSSQTSSTIGRLP